jgi:hypothetical protein
MSGDVLLYVDAKSVERNEGYESFSSACLEPERGVTYGALFLLREFFPLISALLGDRCHRLYRSTDDR